MRLNLRTASLGCALLALFAGASICSATLRVVTYNIDDDTGNPSGTDPRTPMSSLSTVLQAIGSHHLAGNAQPIDVLALQELHYDTPSVSSSLPAIISQLNAFYGANTYAYHPFVGDSTGNLPGNGPNGLVYNTHTVQVMNALGIGTADGNGAPRQPIRYKLHPLGYQSAANFYVYVSHYKALSDTAPDTTNMDRRNVEATEIRADADALGAAAHIIYAGDFNLTGQGSQSNRTIRGSQEPAYLTLTGVGNGQAKDPQNAPANWDNTSAFIAYETESSTSLSARFDFQLVTGPVLNQNGFQYAPGSYEVFGNNGSTAFHGRTDAAGNTALADLGNRTTVLNLLTSVTDHLPVVADYNIVGVATPEPGLLGLIPLILIIRRRRA